MDQKANGFSIGMDAILPSTSPGHNQDKAWQVDKLCRQQRFSSVPSWKDQNLLVPKWLCHSGLTIGIAQIHKWNWPIRNDVLLLKVSETDTRKQDLFNSVDMIFKKCIKRLAFAKPDKFLNVRLQTLCAIFVQFAIWTHLNSPTPKLCISHNTSSVVRFGETKTMPHQNLCYTVYLKQTHEKDMIDIGEAPIHPSTCKVFHSPQASVAIFGPDFPRFQ